LKIWTFSDKQDHMPELICGAREITNGQGFVVSFAVDEETAAVCKAYSADQVYVLPPLLHEQPVESYVPVFAKLLSENKPDIFLFTSTLRGNEIAARLAAYLDVGLGSNCTNLRLDSHDKLIMEKMVLGGAGTQFAVCTQKPQMATIMPNVFMAAKPQTITNTVIEKIEGELSSAVKVISKKEFGKSEVDLSASKTIVCLGRGVEKEEDLELVRGLAQAINGQIGCTRPIAEELHWLPEERYIGISGKRVKPDLYLGVGVSGQVQHISGMREAKVVVAINKDENAPIFEASDYGIVGDLYEVLPLLEKGFKQI